MAVHREAERPEAERAGCLERFSLGLNLTVLTELRQAGIPAPDRWEAVPATKVDPATFTPLETTRDHPVAGRPGLWFTPDRSAAVLDAALFSPLVVGDATRLRPAEQVALGQLAPALVGTVDPRDVLRFLLHADIIGTYWHIGSELCLEHEAGADGYRAVLSGTHTYYTNSHNEEHFRFAFTIDTEGRIGLHGV